MKKTILTIITLLFSALLLGGCATTKMESSWLKDDFSGPPLGHLVVLGLLDSSVQRHVYEDAMVEALQKTGIKAVASHQLLPAFEELQDREKIKLAVHKSGADGALVTTLLGVEQQQRHRPPSVRYVPYYGPRYGLYDYYGRGYRVIHEPGYTVNHTVVKLESTLFAVSNEEMIWAGATRSFNPDSSQQVLDDNCRLIIGAISKAGLLASP